MVMKSAEDGLSLSEIKSDIFVKKISEFLEAKNRSHRANFLRQKSKSSPDEVFGTHSNKNSKK